MPRNIIRPGIPEIDVLRNYILSLTSSKINYTVKINSGTEAGYSVLIEDLLHHQKEGKNV